LIQDLKNQGLSITAIARNVGCDRKTVREYLELWLETPVYGPRQPRAQVIEPYGRIPRNRCADEIGTGGRIKSESVGA
jgi:transposase